MNLQNVKPSQQAQADQAAVSAQLPKTVRLDLYLRCMLRVGSTCIAVAPSQELKDPGLETVQFLQ